MLDWKKPSLWINIILEIVFIASVLIANLIPLMRSLSPDEVLRANSLLDIFSSIGSSLMLLLIAGLIVFVQAILIFYFAIAKDTFGWRLAIIFFIINIATLWLIFFL